MLNQTLDGKMKELQLDKDKCWGRCRVCVGDKVESLECGNTDCDNFYQRQKVLIDIEDLKSKATSKATSEGRGCCF